MIFFIAIIAALAAYGLAQSWEPKSLPKALHPGPWLESWREARRQKALEPQLAPLMELISGALRSGSSLSQALQSAAADSPEPAAGYFSGVARALSLGEAPEAALERLAARMRARACGAELRMLATAVAVTRQSGGNLAEIVSGLAETLRERARLRAEIQSLTAQGKLSGWIVGLLPLLILAALSVLDPALVAPMFHTSLGLGLLALGLVLEAAGAFMIKRIVSLPL